MKVLMINGSPHKNGATMRALEEMKNIFVIRTAVLTYASIFPYVYCA